MRLTSATCRRADARDERGFTLLELLLVMALVALLTGLVAPKMWQWVESARLRAGVDGVRTALEALPRRSFADAERVAVDAKGPLKLPAGWQLELSGPITYEPNGMTLGGRIRVRAGAAVVADWVVVPPAGTVRGARAADGVFRVADVP